MINYYAYLSDSDFLKEIDHHQNKTQFVKISLFNFQEEFLKEIQGTVLDGSVQLSAGQSYRRSADLSIWIDEFKYDNIEDDSLFTLNKKVSIEIGFKNIFGKYLEYDIIWFPMGMFIIQEASASRSSGGLTLSLSLTDKISNLNGFCGGTLPAEVRFDEVDQWVPEVREGETIVTPGQWKSKKTPIFDIIYELVKYYGKENAGKIVITDVPNKINAVVKLSNPQIGVVDDSLVKLYIGYSYIKYTDPNLMPKNLAQNTPDYLVASTNLATVQTFFTSKNLPYAYQEFNVGDDIGYIKSDFYYNNELVSSAGSSVVDVLEQIKNLCGNFEYFYDINGNFVFQEIKNYLNTSQSTTIEKMLKENPDFQADFSKGKNPYSFEDDELVISFSNVPQYDQIKNDFIIWGKRKNVDDTELPFRYRVCIDNKPTVGNSYNVCLQKIQSENKTTDSGDEGGEDSDIDVEVTTTIIAYTRALLIINDFTTLDKLKIENPKNTNVVYGIPNSSAVTGRSYYYYDANKDTYNLISFTDGGAVLNSKDFILMKQPYITKDWRDELYFSGLYANYYKLPQNDYFDELSVEWPKLYNFETQTFYPQVLKGTDIDYFLDFIDARSSKIGALSVKNIGRRTMVQTDDTVNCIYEPEFPNIIWEEDKNLSEGTVVNWDPITRVCKVPKDLYPYLKNLGGKYNGAYYKLRDLLYQNTSYQEAISITTVPIYHLQPNTRITVEDYKSGIAGDYMINSVSIPLTVDGTTTLSCSKVLEKI